MDFIDVALKILHDGTTQDIEIFFVIGLYGIVKTKRFFKIPTTLLNKCGALQELSGGTIKKLTPCIIRASIMKQLGGKLPPLECTKLM